MSEWSWPRPACRSGASAPPSSAQSRRRLLAPVGWPRLRSHSLICAATDARRDDKLRTLIIYDPAGCPPDMGLENRARSPGARMLGARGLGGSPSSSRHGSISVRCAAMPRHHRRSCS
jgi:hypothetical protein